MIATRHLGMAPGEMWAWGRRQEEGETAPDGEAATGTMGGDDQHQMISPRTGGLAP
jgi:hypothetical protein